MRLELKHKELHCSALVTQIKSENIGNVEKNEKHVRGHRMILQTGLRTDIPAFYSRWFANRLQAGFVCVRNPYNPVSVTRYTLSPDVIEQRRFAKT